MKDRDTPLRLVRKWERMIPGIYTELDHLQAAKTEGEMSWPDYCDLPISAAYTYLVFHEGLSNQTAAMVAAELTACWTWRRTKKIYSFAPELARSLADQAEDAKDTDVLPADLLRHLPYPCIYVKAPTLLENIDGFWAWIEHDTNADRTEFRVQWVSSDMEHSVPQVLHLLPGKTLKDCVMDTMHTTMEHLDLDIKPQDSGVENARIILSAIQLVLYLLSENAEIDWVPKPVRHQHISGNLSKLETVEDKASTVDESLVGVRIGAALKKAHYIHASSGFAGSGRTKRSHTRRGHWHHYWTGSTNGNRMLVLKWTAPTVIHPESGADDSNVVVFPVKK